MKEKRMNWRRGLDSEAENSSINCFSFEVKESQATRINKKRSQQF